jgi:hypothetical protein
VSVPRRPARQLRRRARAASREVVTYVALKEQNVVLLAYSDSPAASRPLGVGVPRSGRPCPGSAV